MQPVPSNARATAARQLLLAIVAYSLFLLLATLVAHRPPQVMDLWAHAWVGHGDLSAWILTWSLYALWLGPLCIILLVVAVVRPQWRARIIVSIVLLVVMWGASDLLQHVFARPRRLDWIVKHETAFSYPSTHATLALSFYGFWAYLLSRSELPPKVRLVGSVLLLALVAGVFWARLELGAHYPSDLLGGALLGIAGVAFVLAICSAFGISMGPSSRD